MAVTNKLYSNFPHLLLEDGLEGDILAQTIRVMLINATGVAAFDQDAHDYVDDVVANEVTGTAYVADGEALASKTCTVSGRVTTFDAGNTSWAASTITAAGAVIYYDDAGGDTDSLLMNFINFDGNKSSDNGTFQLTWHVSGITTFTVSA